jgi:uncharacterized protein (DUF488 family)
MPKAVKSTGASRKTAKPPNASLEDQLASKRAWNDRRLATQADFFTLGYSRRTAAEVLEELKLHRVRTLVDIRHMPADRFHPEWSKKNVKSALESSGIDYVHLPELGIPREVRSQAFQKGNRQILWDWYDHQLASVDLNALAHRFERPAYLCMEVDPTECHRHRLALALEATGLKSFDL